MPKCPKCKKEIDHLKHVATGTETANVCMRAGIADYSDAEFTGDGQILEYKCPACGEVLFDSEDDAFEFLEGKKQNGDEP